MKLSIRKIISAVTIALVGMPLFASAASAGDITGGSGSFAAVVASGFWLAFLGFYFAAVITFFAARKFGKSTLGTIFSYLFMGAGTFFAITTFQTLGGDFFGISDASMDVWWHIMFYMAFASYFYGLKLLVGLGSADQVEDQNVRIGAEKIWGIATIVILSVIFIFAKALDPLISTYTSSIFYSIGVHHFIAVIFAGFVASYLLSVKKNFGQIGRAIANPMILSVAVLSLQHLWELLNESWQVITVTAAVGESVEKILLTIAAIGIGYASWRLNSFARAS